MLFFPPAVYESFSASASLSAILRYIVASHNTFNFHFPDDQWHWTIFHGLFAICISSFETCWFNVAHLLIRLFLFFLLSLGFRSKFFVRYIICNYFLLVKCLSFHSHNNIFHRAEVVNFDEVQITDFLLF